MNDFLKMILAVIVGTSLYNIGHAVAVWLLGIL